MTGDGDQLSTPYPIPGPAGVTRSFGSELQHHITGSNCVIPSRPGVTASTGGGSPPPPSNFSSSPRAHIHCFSNGAWPMALRPMNIHPFGRHRLSTSIASLRSLARANTQAKATTLVARIDALNYVGNDAAVVLADPTGTIVGTLHSHVLQQYKQEVQPGAVLVLSDVWALITLERRAQGFRTDPGHAMYISVHPSNVKRLVSASGMNTEDRSLQSPLDSYLEEARNPPQTRRAIITFQDQGRPSATPPRSHAMSRQPTASRPLGAERRLPQQWGMPEIVQHHIPRDVIARNNLNATRMVNHHNVQIPQSHLRVPCSKRPRPPDSQPSALVPTQRPRMAVEEGYQSPQLVYSNLSPATVIKNNGPKSVAELSEDMLDHLLGDIDIDAAIAASGRTVPDPRLHTNEPCENTSSPQDLLNKATDVEVLVMAKSISASQRAELNQGVTSCRAADINNPVSEGNSSPPVMAVDNPKPQLIPASHNPVDDEIVAALMNDLEADDFTNV